MTARAPVRGRLRVSFEEMGELPGSFAFEASDQGLFYVCPCGCGRESFLPIAGEGRPRWRWDGNREQPTLTPSVRRTESCFFHGYFAAGVWTFCSDSGVGG